MGEQRRIDALLEGARAATSGSLVLVGDPGMGKSALLEYAATQAEGFEIVTAHGVESEAALLFGGLLEICRPLLDRADRLEPQQAQVLRTTLGLAEGSPATPFAIGAATLSLLAAAAEERPLLLLVDDAHWLDRSSADALAFAVRRLRADAVAALFATRPGDHRAFSRRGIPELQLTGLDPSAAAALLERAAEGPLEPRAQHAILALAEGNPLALLELPHHDVSVDQPEEPIRLGKKLERAFAARAETLPQETRRALVVASAIAADDAIVLQKALERVGLGLPALEPAETAGLVSLGSGTPRFRHPIARSALYHAADPAERRAAHAAIAAAIGDDDRAAWHLAAAAVGTDDAAAGALERFAETASRRSGFSAAAAAYERAARLSEGRQDRARRLEAAADAAWLGGRTRHALALIEEAFAYAVDPARRGALLHTRGTIEHFTGDVAHAPVTLEQAASLLVDIDRQKACVSLTQAVGSSLAAGEIERAVRLSERAYAVAEPEQPVQQLLAALARGASLLMAGRPEEGLPFLRRAAAAVEDDSLLTDDPRHLTWAALAAFWLGDATAMSTKAAAAVEWAREHVAVGTLAFAARLLARGQLVTGHWRAARASFAESLDAARLSEQASQIAETLSALAWLDAAQGRVEECRRHVDEGLELAERNNLTWRNGVMRALVLLELGIGVRADSPGVMRVRHELADGPLLRDTPANSTTPDIVELLVRLGERDAAADLLAPFADEAERLGQPFPRAVASRCAALLADVDSYEPEFQLALEAHASDQNVFAEARTRLAYAERLRRSGRRVDAREHLRAALVVFERLEAEPWVERARAELRATGERLQKRRDDERDELTPQELQIALVVAEGKTNREAGAQLFLSPKTVEWHLGHIYRKLSVRSRAELGRVVADDADTRALMRTSA